MTSPDAIAGLYAWWRADDAGTSDGDAVTTWPDRGPNGLDLAQATAAAKPTFKTGILSGQPVVRFDGGDFLAAATASDWTFLHDGSNWQVYVVWKTRLAEPDAAYALLDTGGMGSADTGMALWYDDRAAVPRIHKHLCWVAKGTLGTFSGLCTSVDYAARGARWHLTGAVHWLGAAGEDLATGTDGRLADTSTTPALLTPSSAAPSGALHVGSRYNGTDFLFDGDIAEVIIYDTTLPEASRRGLESYFLARYPDLAYYLPQAAQATIIADGEHNAFGGFAIADDGTFVATYRKGSGHDVPGDAGDIIVARSTARGATGTWTEQVVLANASWDYRDPSINKLADGTLIIHAGRRDPTPATTTTGAVFVLSTDHGETWGSEIVPTGIFTGWSRGGSPVLELSNGDLLATVYGKATADTYTSTKVVKSTDGGSTWSVLATAANGPTDSLDYNEASIVDLDNGTLRIYAREETTEAWFTGTSSDAGATWSALTSVMGAATGWPKVIRRPSDGLIIGACRKTDDSDYPRWMSSVDDGVTMQVGDELQSPLTPYYYAYGQGVFEGERLWYAYFEEPNATDADGYLIAPYFVQGWRVGQVVGFQ